MAFRTLYIHLSSVSHVFCFLPLLRLPLPLNCFLLHFSLYTSSDILVITVGLAFCPSLYILQHVKQNLTHINCITHHLVGMEQSEKAPAKGKNSIEESEKDVEVWGQDCTQ